jgi:DNA-directed RNA polymerase specialized sigma24 family protein
MVHSSGESASCSAIHEVNSDFVAVVAERLFRVARAFSNSEGEADEYVLVAVEIAWMECKSLVGEVSAVSFERYALTALAKCLISTKNGSGQTKANLAGAHFADAENRNFLEAFAELESGYRLIIDLIDVEQLSVSEVSLVLGLAPEHVRRKLNRARLRLSQIFTGLENTGLHDLPGTTPTLGKTSTG